MTENCRTLSRTPGRRRWIDDTSPSRSTPTNTVPGSSEVFRGAVVSYASEVKFDLLDVPEGPVVSAAAAEAMATGARKALEADVGLSFTGVAGPEPHEGHDPGTVFIGVDLDGAVSSIHLRLPGDRLRVRQFSVISGFGYLRNRLLAR